VLDVSATGALMKSLPWGRRSLGRRSLGPEAAPGAAAVGNTHHTPAAGRVAYPWALRFTTSHRASYRKNLTFLATQKTAAVLTNSSFIFAGPPRTLCCHGCSANFLIPKIPFFEKKLRQISSKKKNNPTNFSRGFLC